MAISRAIVFGLGVALAAGCMGSVGGGSGNGSGSSGAIDAAIDGSSSHPIWHDAALHDASGVACANPQTPPGDGHHNPGISCFQSCHNHGFTLAGTLYANTTSNTIIAGGTITITDANNQTLTLVTMTNGNFYTSTAIAFPVRATASECPATATMMATSTTGACNTCHAGGTSQQMDLP